MISIVTAYFNRKELLDKTIESIEASAIKDYEIIVVDDASAVPLVCDKAKVIRIEPENKWWHNSCIPFNIGFSHASGDVIIIQNPEAYHVGDILSYVDKHISDGKYLSFACYALNPKDTVALHRGVLPEPEVRKYKHPENNGWYNHSAYAPTGFHFCSAITKGNLVGLGGFDKRYADGISYDDNDLVQRVKKTMKLKIIDYPFVLHQYHYPFNYKQDGYMNLHTINKNIFIDTWGKSAL